MTCYEYNGWDLVLPKAIEFLTQGLSFIDLDSLLVIAVGCQILDKFAYSPIPEPYDLSDVFNLKSEYLPIHVQRASEARPIWHAFHGWFEPSDAVPNTTILNQLNISTATSNEKLISEISHIIEVVFSIPINAKKIFEKSNVETGVKFFLNKAHDYNKLILRNLLSSNKIKEIGLEP